MENLSEVIPDRIIDKLAAHFSVDNHIETTPEKDYLVTEVKFKSKILYTHRLDLEPLYESFASRIDKED